jgi:hypothetical protein
VKEVCRIGRKTRRSPRTAEKAGRVQVEETGAYTFQSKA